MNFTFGICAGVISKGERLDLERNLTRNRGESNIEIIYVGKRPDDWETTMPDVFRWIDFDETVKPKAWITRKKNLIAQEAKYENIVFMHDYIRLGPEWYDGWEYFGENFEVACNCIMTSEGFRHSDWVVDPYMLWEAKPELKDKFWDVSLRYEDTQHTHLQYISGNYWLAKKWFMLENPLDETLMWGDAEDIEWSRRVRTKCRLKFNVNSYVKITKPKKWAPGLLPRDYLIDMEALYISKQQAKYAVLFDELKADK